MPVRFDGGISRTANCSLSLWSRIINNMLGNLFPLSGCELVKNIYEPYDISNSYK